MSEHRKIELPAYCCPGDVRTVGGQKDCDHDYPPESKDESASFVTWTCSICGLKICVGVYS